MKVPRWEDDQRSVGGRISWGFKILPTNVCLVKAIVFPVVMYGCESWTLKKAECQWIDAFELWCWRRLLRVPWTARRSNQSILKEISPEYSLEGLMLKLKLKLQYFDHLMQRTDSLEKTLMLGKIEGSRRRGWQRIRWLDGIPDWGWAMPGFPVYHQLPELAQTHVHCVGNAIQPSHLCCPLLPLPSIFPSIRVFSNESDSASILSVNIKDWFPVLPGQGSQPHIKGKVSSEPGFLFLMPSLTSPLTVRVQLIRSLASVREEQKENPPVGSSAFSPTFSD